MTETATITETISAVSPLLDRLRRFSRSLGLALLDRELEIRGNSVVYYYDTNVVYTMILGFEAELAGTKEKTVKQRLVRSLLSCHRLGTVDMLRPHVLELDKSLHHLPKPTRQEEWDALRGRVNQYLEKNSITEILSHLRNASTDSIERTDEVKVEKFLEILRKEGAETFTAIEQVTGTWTARLRRYYDQELLRFDRLGLSVQKLMDNHRTLVFEILEILERFRPNRRVPNLHDSMALAILHRKLQERDQDHNADIVRFYSHDRALNEACREDQKLRDLLSHRSPLIPDEEVSPELRSVVRDDDYFLMRLRFEELSPGRDDKKPTDLSKIESLHSEIRQILDKQSGTELRDKTLRHIHWKGKPLLEVLDEFENLALMDSIWVRHKLPDSFVKNLDQWTDVFHFAQSGEFSESLDEKITDIQRELRSKVSLMRRWTENFKILQQGSRSMRKNIRKEIENPMRDLGLVRWGYNLSDDMQDDLTENVMYLLQTGQKFDQSMLDDVCSELAGRMDAACGDVDECLFMSAVLWAIGKYDALVRLIDACEKVSTLPKFPPTLVVLRAAAKLKALDDRGQKDKEETFAEKKRLVHEVLNLWATLPKAGGYLLGVGYALYHAWKSESRAVTVGDAEATVAEEVQKWAHESLRAGKEARKNLPPGGLGWAFAVNHCAYVSLVTEAASEDEQEEYRQALADLDGEAVWHSRFADTLGCYHMIRMEREWKATPPAERSKLDFYRGIRRAKEHFEAAREADFGDIDLINHMRRLEDLKDRYEAVRP